MPHRPQSFLVRPLALLLALLVSAVAAAQQPAEPETGQRPNERPFLWRIEGQAPAYLFGTFHLADERVTDLQPDVESALAGADAVFTEIEMDLMVTPALMQAMRLPAGKSLRDVVPAALLDRLRKRLGLPDDGPRSLPEMKPWVLAMQVLTARKRQTGQVLDLLIYKDAKSAGKEVGGLETIEEQLSVFEGLGLPGEVAYLGLTLDLLDDYERRGLDVCEEMIKAYCAGDTARTLRFFDEMNGDGELWGRLSRTLLIDRNLRMAERIDRKLHEQPDRKFVFAIGTGHLIGETCVVDLLRARGYVVTRIPETLANLDEELQDLEQEVERRQIRIQQLRSRRAAVAAAGRKKAG